ncbi:MAG: PQQ-dependent sugar dehydrogenase, partial [Thermoanaerobaculia bacterium]|nr:PQQ-dependent sugar dehydrogenase [Thermoanaerobaculia bacterium]
TLSTVARLPVFVINELGLLGMALDPNWEKNHWIYLYYSEPGKKEVNRLSRFVFTGDSLYTETETMLLEIGIQRDECCHYAGCVKFDAQGCLYLSAGDNSDFSESEGFAPIDERPGHDIGDAQRSAANSMDLRGKILRIKPLPDGSYLCPAGNLFAEQDIVVSPFTQMMQENPLWTGFVPHGQTHVLPVHGPAAPIRLPGFRNRSAGRPEIYVMGCRNPFRLSIDSRRNFLFWGDPGPQAGLPDSTRGPEGFDEINCAPGPGFFGWPYFIGNNKAYRDYDFERKKTGPAFDPQHPFNDSPRNTGIKNLPPAQPALIWYPYASSPEFPSLANGASCAMAGPVYYSDQYPAASRFPDEFDGNVIIYDWMRNWMVAVALDSAGRLIRLAPLAESVPLSRPIDMMFDKNGSLWVLEYGTKWFDPNPDACLSRIDYRRGNGRDTAAVSSPVVHWNFGKRNRSFYRPGELLNYKIMVTDPQAGSLEDGGIPASAVAARISYTPAPFHPGRKKQQRPDGQNKTALQRGENLVNSSDCKACHDAERQINGPAYQSIAARYDSDKTAIPRLVSKVIKGGSGVWGDRAMSAHPQLKEQEAREMVRWILSLSDPANRALPLQGAYSLAAPPSDKGGLPNAPGTYIFHAAYTANNTSSPATRTASETIALRPNLQHAEQADHISPSARVKRLPGSDSPALCGLKDQYFFGFKQIDLRGIISVTLRLHIPYNNASTIELRLDGPDGRLLGSTHTPASNNPGPITFSDIPLSVDQTSWPNDDSFHDIYFIVKQEKKSPFDAAAVDWVRFNF